MNLPITQDEQRRAQKCFEELQAVLRDHGFYLRFSAASMLSDARGKILPDEYTTGHGGKLKGNELLVSDYEATILGGIG